MVKNAPPACGFATLLVVGCRVKEFMIASFAESSNSIFSPSTPYLLPSISSQNSSQCYHPSLSADNGISIPVQWNSCTMPVKLITLLLCSSFSYISLHVCPFLSTAGFVSLWSIRINTNIPESFMLIFWRTIWVSFLHRNVKTSHGYVMFSVTRQLYFVFHRFSISIDKDLQTEKKKEIWLSPMTKKIYAHSKNPKRNVTTHKRHQKLRIHNNCWST